MELSTVLSLLLKAGIFGGGLFTAVLLDVKAPRVYGFLTRQVAKLLLKF